jgi:uncharacterized protein YeaO (DUF488 family)
MRHLRTSAVTRENGYVVICMRHYPRNFPKTLRDEYQPLLAPDAILFEEWKKAADTFGHDPAFAQVNYEKRFALGPEAQGELARLAELSRERNVYLVCQCAVGERCHRELLLLAARSLFEAEIGHVYHSYPDFEKRLPELGKS